MKVSIVTISYNQARFLEDAIRSVLEQDYPDIEYIVIDPGSTDGSRQIIERYRNCIDHIIFEPDDGPADGLSKGFSYATGDIYGFLNSDDILLPGAISRVVEFFKKNLDVDVMTGRLYMVDDGLNIIKTIQGDEISPVSYVYWGINVAQQSTFFRRSAYHKAGGFNVNNRTSWDGELFLKMALSGCKFKKSKEFLSAFRVHDSSITGSQSLVNESRYNHDRYFRMVMGRSRNSLDNIISIFYRLFRYFRDPVIAYWLVSAYVYKMFGINKRLIVDFGGHDEN
ncbi:glycosyltransferase [Methylomarinovum caldicuralii]|uniref:Glycosyltransferase n=1 Tax=Methylomarinovum caldicuralii TaxID=438856 RepID=A0AAU9C3K3_9GAMM|nr:glycosyltransferase family 2 protein [Methylomarinovum caldicuralii]BCX82258.1 glycosyltransferase [Methylomarinovum caldicuralii]